MSGTEFSRYPHTIRDRLVEWVRSTDLITPVWWALYFIGATTLLAGGFLLVGPSSVAKGWVPAFPFRPTLAAITFVLGLHLYTWLVMRWWARHGYWFIAGFHSIVFYAGQFFAAGTIVSNAAWYIATRPAAFPPWLVRLTENWTVGGVVTVFVMGLLAHWFGQARVRQLTPAARAGWERRVSDRDPHVADGGEAGAGREPPGR